MRINHNMLKSLDNMDSSLVTLHEKKESNI